MRGKKPKERKCYVLRMPDGTLVQVTREVYLEWYQSRRSEKYQIEKGEKFGVCSLNELEEKGISIGNIDDLEGQAINKLCLDKLWRDLEKLPEQDVNLIYLLFFEETSMKEAAQICGCSPKTIQNRKRKILIRLRKMAEECGFENAY